MSWIHNVKELAIHLLHLGLNLGPNMGDCLIIYMDRLVLIWQPYFLPHK